MSDRKKEDSGNGSGVYTVQYTTREALIENMTTDESLDYLAEKTQEYSDLVDKYCATSPWRLIKSFRLGNQCKQKRDEVEEIGLKLIKKIAEGEKKSEHQGKDENQGDETKEV